MKNWWFWRGGEKGVPQGSAGDLRPETTKLQGGKSDIMSHDATHRQAMDMGPPAYERARQTAYTVKRLNFFNGFLVTLVQGEVCFPGDLQGICGQKPRNY